MEKVKTQSIPKYKIDKINNLIHKQKKIKDLDCICYERGVYNGMESIVSVIEDRSPNVLEERDVDWGQVLRIDLNIYKYNPIKRIKFLEGILWLSSTDIFGLEYNDAPLENADKIKYAYLYNCCDEVYPYFSKNKIDLKYINLISKSYKLFDWGGPRAFKAIASDFPVNTAFQFPNFLAAVAWWEYKLGDVVTRMIKKWRAQRWIIGPDKKMTREIEKEIIKNIKKNKNRI